EPGVDLPHPLADLNPVTSTLFGNLYRLHAGSRRRDEFHLSEREASLNRGWPARGAGWLRSVSRLIVRPVRGAELLPSPSRLIMCAVGARPLNVISNPAWRRDATRWVKKLASPPRRRFGDAHSDRARP